MESEKYTKEYIIKHADFINWASVCHFCSLNILTELMADYEENFLWDIISRRPLEEQFIRENSEKILWFDIFNGLHIQEYTDQFFIDYAEEIRWRKISSLENLSENFIEKYKFKLNWNVLCNRQNFSKEFLMKHLDQLAVVEKILNISKEF